MSSKSENFFLLVGNDHFRITKERKPGTTRITTVTISRSEGKDTVINPSRFQLPFRVELEVLCQVFYIYAKASLKSFSFSFHFRLRSSFID